MAGVCCGTERSFSINSSKPYAPSRVQRLGSLSKTLTGSFPPIVSFPTSRQWREPFAEGLVFRNYISPDYIFLSPFPLRSRFPSSRIVFKHRVAASQQLALRFQPLVTLYTPFSLHHIPKEKMRCASTRPTDLHQTLHALTPIPR